jgi:carbon monoxide dehydrogenase subunit G
MQLENSFTVPAAPDAAWDILLDVPRIAPCMPGAELTETVGEHSYKGNAKLRVGPVALTFSGEATITEIDTENRVATVEAKGNDTKGRGAASARVEFRLVADGAGSRVDITSDIDLTGSIAQYGRASGLIDAIAGQIIADFAENLAAEIGASDAPEAAPAESAPDDAAAPAPAAAPPSDNSISGIRLFFRALWSMLRGGRASRTQLT